MWNYGNNYESDIYWYLQDPEEKAKQNLLSHLKFLPFAGGILHQWQIRPLIPHAGISSQLQKIITYERRAINQYKHVTLVVRNIKVLLIWKRLSKYFYTLEKWTEKRAWLGLFHWSDGYITGGFLFQKQLKGNIEAKSLLVFKPATENKAFLLRFTVSNKYLDSVSHTAIYWINIHYLHHGHISFFLL